VFTSKKSVPSIFLKWKYLPTLLLEIIFGYFMDLFFIDFS